MVGRTVRALRRRRAPWRAALASLAALASAHVAAAASVPTRFVSSAPFAMPIGIAPGRNAATLADLNGDDRPDLVAIEPADRRVSIRLNDGSGQYPSAAYVYLTVTPTAVAVADVTSIFQSAYDGAPDGRPDILIGSDAGELQIAVADFDGSYVVAGDPISPSETRGIIGMALGDFDTRLGPDVALLDRQGLLLLCSDGGGGLVPCRGPSLVAVGADPIEIVSGDFNGDGHVDLAVLDRTAQQVLPLFGDGAGRMAAAAPVDVAGETRDRQAVDMAVADLDMNARDDLVIVNDDEFFEFLAVALLGNADRTFRVEPFVVDFAVASVAAVDLDGDGLDDVVTGYRADASSHLAVNLNTGNGEWSDPFSPLGAQPVGAAPLLLAGDLNGDGLGDVVTADGVGSARVLLGVRNPPPCGGDCNGDHVVSIDELTRGIGLLLAGRSPLGCATLDRDGSGRITIDELVGAVTRALHGCPPS